MQHTSSAEYTTFIFNELIMKKRGCKALLNADLRNGRERRERKMTGGEQPIATIFLKLEKGVNGK